jgi:tetratricopeptide (TPR) repeat protein
MRDMARAHYYNKEYEKAIDELLNLLELQPDFVRAYKFLAFSYLETGRPDEAEKAYAKALELDKSENEIDNLSFFAEIKAASGQIGEAETLIEEMLSYREQYRKGGAASIALAYLRLHDVEKAMQWLDAAAAENDLPPSLLVDPRWDLLRNRPDFEELVNQAPM